MVSNTFRDCEPALGWLSHITHPWSGDTNEANVPHVVGSGQPGPIRCHVRPPSVVFISGAVIASRSYRNPKPTEGVANDGFTTFACPRSVQVWPPSLECSSAGQMYAHVWFSTAQASELPETVTETTGFSVLSTVDHVAPPSEVVSITPAHPLSQPGVPNAPTAMPWSASKNATLPSW